MNVPEDVACGMVRLSVGSPTTESEISAAAEMLIAAVKLLQKGARVRR
jgi:cysteine sulfinate desulfinase/cysteine desulfurase-like protein